MPTTRSNLPPIREVPNCTKITPSPHVGAGRPQMEIPLYGVHFTSRAGTNPLYIRGMSRAGPGACDFGRDFYAPLRRRASRSGAPSAAGAAAPKHPGRAHEGRQSRR